MVLVLIVEADLKFEECISLVRALYRLRATRRRVGVRSIRTVC